MGIVSLEFLKEQLDLGEELLAGRERMFEPCDLPGRYGRVVKAIEHVLKAMGCESVLGGGWAVWHHGFVGRLTQDVDIVLPAERVEEFLRVAGVAGFEVLPQPKGRWPKLMHKDSKVKVDILPEGARPGTASKLAPTTIRHPAAMGAAVGSLHYINLPALVELKVAAGRVGDEHDVVMLIRANPDRVESIRNHLASIHADCVQAFDHLVERAQEQQER